jgi:hypothetical protein
MFITFPPLPAAANRDGIEAEFPRKKMRNSNHIFKFDLSTVALVHCLFEKGMGGVSARYPGK